MNNTTICKMNGAGNDFVVVDNRLSVFDLKPEFVSRLCHRHFGIGADGLLSLEQPHDAGAHDFRMVYYNSDGYEGSMCGNGGRCIAAFAMMLGMSDTLSFEACDGVHDARILKWDGRNGVVSLSMKNVPKVSIWSCEHGCFIDTGSPHFILPADNLKDYDVVREGKRWRNRADFFPEGANIDFITEMDDGVHMRTYERGVEDETLACGTGVTAVALTTRCHTVFTREARFNVDFHEDASHFFDVVLTGPVEVNCIIESL